MQKKYWVLLILLFLVGLDWYIRAPDSRSRQLTGAIETQASAQLLLRPDEVLSGIPDAPVLEVADNAFGVLFKPHHVRVGGFT